MKNKMKIRLIIFSVAAFVTVLTGQVLALEAPTNPVSSIEPNVCTGDRTINISWDAPDAGTTGIKGYSVLWDEQPEALPDETVTVTKTHTTSPYLNIGNNHYAHIRAADNNDNWSEKARHVGPFCIEAYQIPGDINDDDAVTLPDAMLGLKLISDMDIGDDPIQLGADVNWDGAIGLAEVIYILKRISGLIFLPGDYLRPEELKLAKLINIYRHKNSLEDLPISKSLTQTAQEHLIDLHENEPDEGECTQHSWSDQGYWTPVCDTGVPETWAIMQAKPREITYGAYTADGYEVAYNNVMEHATAELAKEYLTGSPNHNMVILQQGSWYPEQNGAPKPWSVMGVGLYEHHAAIWFGTEDDPQGLIFLPGYCLRPEEAELAKLINEYRQKNGLDALPISKSLTQTAQEHLIDLHENEPDEGDCTQHSWSDQGYWTPVCDTGVPETWAIMQAKPREITYGTYTADGYEVAYNNVMEQATAELAKEYLTGSDAHNNVILQQGSWDPEEEGAPKSWTVMGVGLYEHHAVIWFGTEDDPQGEIKECQ